METEFKIGDRVEVIKDYDNARKGMVGTCIGVNSFHISVRFDSPFIGGHTCGGKCEDDFGHNMHPERLKLINSEIIYEIY